MRPTRNDHVPHSHHTHAHHGPGGADTDRERTLGLTLGANGVLLVAQIAVGLLAGSLAVLADAVHQGVDVVALALAWLAAALARRPARPGFTYGFRQVEVLAALANGVLLGASSIWIVLEALDRLGTPADIDAPLVIGIGAVGLAVNGWGALAVSRHAGRSTNLRAAGWHLATDAAGSAAVVVVGVVAVAGALDAAGWLDPLASLAIAAAALWAAVGLVRDTLRQLLAAAPRDVDMAAVEATIRHHPEVQDVHHLHVWSLGDRDVALSAHVVVGEQLSLHEARAVTDQLEDELVDHHVTHATFQVECHGCD